MRDRSAPQYPSGEGGRGASLFAGKVRVGVRGLSVGFGFGHSKGGASAPPANGVDHHWRPSGPRDPPAFIEPAAIMLI